MFVFALAVVFKLCSIQFIQGDAYRALAEKRTVKDFEIPANRGNVYSADGSAHDHLKFVFLIHGSRQKRAK